MGELNLEYPNFPLRLYALKISEKIVVLFNGGVKDGPTNQTSSLHMNWKEACAFARKIIHAMQCGQIIVHPSGRLLSASDGNHEIILL